MKLLDVNVLVYAHRADAPEHADYRDWLEALVNRESFSIADSVASGFLRILTHPKIFQNPCKPQEALAMLNALLNHEHCRLLFPGPRHFSAFTELCKKSAAKGNLIPDMYLAAMAITEGLTLVSADKGFARIPKLSWEKPL